MIDVRHGIVRCDIDGCHRLAAFTSRKDGRTRRTCEACAIEMRAVWGWALTPDPRNTNYAEAPEQPRWP